MPAASKSQPQTKSHTRPASNELHLTRFYNAPVKAVWDAWTDKTQVGHWWGPRGFTLTNHAHDLRPGGHWTYTMHGPDGTDYGNKALYLEVIPYQKLVYDHGGNEDANPPRPPLFRVTVTFKDLGNTTQMDMTMTLPTPEAAEETRKFIKKAGGESTWDRFAEYLEKQKTGKDTFVINRSFAAPRETVFDMWAKPENLAKWLGPAGSEMAILDGSIAPGKTVFYRMTIPNAPVMHGHIHYREIRRPELLIYIQNFSDENQNIARHPLVSTWPATMLTTVTFVDEPDNRTRVTVTWEPQNPSSEDLNTFLTMRPGITQGWSASFDKLEDLLA